MIQEQTSYVLSALRTIGNERKGLDALEKAIRTTREGGLGAAFSEAVKTISAAPGRVIVTGIGKSGHIARKIAATLASTGEPAFFVHPAEASHGDLGMVQTGDVVLAISWSGETSELAAIVTFAKRYAIPLIAMTAEASSTLGRQADVCLTMPTAPEASPNGLEAPTTSTTMQLVLGDALAIALLEGRGFTALDFRALHPGGKLGAKLMHVREVMHTGDRIPRVLARARMAEAIVEMSSKGFGCVGRARRQRRAGRYRHGRRPAPPSPIQLFARDAGRRRDDPHAAHHQSRRVGRGGAGEDQPEGGRASSRRERRYRRDRAFPRPHAGWRALTDTLVLGASQMADKTTRIGAIVEVMLDTWDLPADCNEGELYTYAETLYDRIETGDSKDKLYAYLSEVQVDHLEMARSDAFKAIVDRVVEMVGRPS